MKKTLTILLVLLSSLSFGQVFTPQRQVFTPQELEQDTTQTIRIQTPHTQYAVLSIPSYHAFNSEISIKKGYKKGDKTSQVYSDIPSKYCLVDSVLMTVISLSTTNQQFYTGELFERSEINFVDTVLIDQKIELMNKKVLNWVKINYKKTDTKKGSMFLLKEKTIEIIKTK